MTILAFDTTHGFCSVAIKKDSKILSSHIIEETSKQAEMLIPTIERVIIESAIDYKDIQTISTTVGPGSFTGVRIGLAAAHGLLLATEAAFFGVSALEAVAWKVKQERSIRKDLPLYVVLDARRKELFLQSFDINTLKPLSAAILCDYETAESIINEKPAIISGNGIDVIKQSLSPSHQLIGSEFLPDAESVAQLAAFKLQHNEEGFPATPLYIRKPDAKIPTKKII